MGPFPVIPCSGVRGSSEPDRTSSLTPQPSLTTFFFFFLRFIYLFLAVLDLCCCTQAFSSCCKWGLLSSWGCTGFSLRWPLLGSSGSRLSHCGSWAQLPHGTWDLPKAGIEPVSPALAGRLSTARRPGKSHLLTTVREFPKPHGPICPARLPLQMTSQGLGCPRKVKATPTPSWLGLGLLPQGEGNQG